MSRDTACATSFPALLATFIAVPSSTPAAVALLGPRSLLLANPNSRHPGRRPHTREEQLRGRPGTARPLPPLTAAAAHRRRRPTAGTRCHAQPLGMMAAPAACCRLVYASGAQMAAPRAAGWVAAAADSGGAVAPSQRRQPQRPRAG